MEIFLTQFIAFSSDIRLLQVLVSIGKTIICFYFFYLFCFFGNIHRFHNGYGHLQSAYTIRENKEHLKKNKNILQKKS